MRGATNASREYSLSVVECSCVEEGEGAHMAG